MFDSAKIITAGNDISRVPVFKKKFSTGACKRAKLTVGSIGTHDVFLNGKRVGDRVLAPGWQDFETRICACVYDLEDLSDENELCILLNNGFFTGAITARNGDKYQTGLIAEIEFDGKIIGTDESWQVSDSKYESSDIYHGFVYDANFEEQWQTVNLYDGDDYYKIEKSMFVPDTTVPVKEFETVYPAELIITPAGERVLDFGANIVGYPVLDIVAKKGERISFSFGEVLSSEGNFYNENYRAALCLYDYTCCDGQQSFTPCGTYYGWRYLRIDEMPENVDPMGGGITARMINADMRRTGNIRTGNELVNRLFNNIILGQRGNYLVVPTDCPQRNERFGWTGDAQVFAKTAAYNYDVKDYMSNWLCDIVSTQKKYGHVLMYVPSVNLRGSKPGIPEGYPRSGWADAITIIPWELYMTYGDTAVLENCFDAMKLHVDAMTANSTTPDLYTGKKMFGDWLGLDAPEGSYKGASDDDIISSAYYAYSTMITVQTGKILNRDVSEYEALYSRIRAKYIETYEKELKTQTELCITLHFCLTDDPVTITKRLVDKIHSAGDKLETGFIGTPYILHALSENGESDLAYKLLMRTEYPSWLYPVTKGATTIWEHWDGLRPDGTMWSKDMNSFNHYAYGAVADWIYSVAAGIKPQDAGYSRAVIAPVPDKRLGMLDVTFDSCRGRFESSWYFEGDTPHYRIVTPVPATLIINGRTLEVEAGAYML